MWNPFKRKKPAKPPEEAPGWPESLPPLGEFARELRRKCSLQASLMVADRGTDEGLFSTRLGEVRALGKGETWPEYQGRPMIGICQINPHGAPYVPAVMRDLAFLSVFMAADEKDHGIDFPFDHQDDYLEKYVVRGYRSTEELIAATNRPENQPFKPCGVRWEIFDDPMPNVHNMLESEGYENRLSEGQIELLNDKIFELNEELQEKQWGSKLGGWPAPIQDDIIRPLAFQLGCHNEVGLQWIDGGCAYFWREPGELPEWAVQIDFY